MKQLYNLSIRCYVPGAGNHVTHRQIMPLEDVAKWVKAYQFTHPNCQSVSIMVYLHEEIKEGKV